MSDYLDELWDYGFFEAETLRWSGPKGRAYIGEWGYGLESIWDVSARQIAHRFDQAQETQKVTEAVGWVGTADAAALACRVVGHTDVDFCDRCARWIDE